MNALQDLSKSPQDGLSRLPPDHLGFGLATRAAATPTKAFVPSARVVGCSRAHSVPAWDVAHPSPFFQQPAGARSAAASAALHTASR